MSDADVAAILLGVGWIFGQILLAPVHCGGPVCARWYQQFQLATRRSIMRIGCLILAAVTQQPRLFRPLGAGILGYTAFTSTGNVGTIMLIGVDFVLVVGVIGWLLMTRRGR